MTITAERARELLYAAHDAWNARDIERMLSLYVDDLTHWANVGGPDGGTLTILGKEAFRQQLQQWKALESISVPHHFRYVDGLGRANVEFYVRDPGSGHTYSGTYRQVLSYRDDRILRSEVFHDATALAAFLDLISHQ